MPEPTKSESAAVRGEPRTTAVADWSPDRIRQAERECASGNYSLAADLCEAMMADERVSKSLDRLYAAMTLPLAFQMPGMDAERSKANPICQALDFDWWKILPEQQGKTLMRWLGLFGCAPGHINGYAKDPETGRAISKIEIWSPRNVRNDAERGWIVKTASRSNSWFSEEETFTPGDGNWVLFLAGANYRGPYQSPWRGIARWWLLKLYAQVDWASSSERHGQGIGKVTNLLSGSGENADVGEPLNAEKRKKLADDLSKMGRNGTTALPRGWDYELMVDAANTHQTFAKQTDYANSAIDIGLTGTNLTTEVNGGSRAAISVHATVDSVRMSSLLELVSTVMREQVLVHWHTLNFGVGFAPYAHWDTTPPEDEKARAEARAADAKALLTYRQAGVQLNQKKWFEGKVELIETASDEFPPLPSGGGQSATGADGTDTIDGGDGTDSTDQQPPKVKPKPGALAKAKTDRSTAFQRGRDYVDLVEGECVRRAAKELAPTVAAMVSAIEDSTDFEDAKARIKAAYGDELPPSKLLKLTEAAMIVSQLAGRETVEQEFITDE